MTLQDTSLFPGRITACPSRIPILKDFQSFLLISLSLIVKINFIEYKVKDTMIPHRLTHREEITRFLLNTSI